MHSAYNLEVVMKKSIYINTSPKVNTKADGTTFYTVLVGVIDQLLKEKVGKTKAEMPALTLTMEVFPEKVELFTKAFIACKKSGKKLILEADDVTITEVKENVYVNATGMTVRALAASCWGTGDVELKIQNGKFSISAELADMMGELESDDI
jgi:hypothetical protein